MFPLLKGPHNLMKLCVVTVTQDQEMSHKEPQGHDFSFHRGVCKERRQNTNATFCFCEKTVKQQSANTVDKMEEGRVE